MVTSIRGVLFLLALSACSSTKDDQLTSVCSGGQSIACACTDGRMGSQTCNSATGQYEACTCTGTPNTGMPEYCTSHANTEGEPGCTKVDFLFVVDNSLSMANEQEKLISAFPGFVNAIKSTLRAQDYHLMVVDTDGLAPLQYGWNACETQCDQSHTTWPGMYQLGWEADNCREPDRSELCTICSGGGGGGDGGGDCRDHSCPDGGTSEPDPRCVNTPYVSTPPSWWCENYDCGEIDALNECDTALGAGVKHPVAPNASNRECAFANGRFMTSADNANLDSLFACAARVGSFGYGHEQPVGASLRALTPLLNGAGGCNEGFLREDALLVVVYLSDASADDGSYEEATGDIEAWRRQLIDYKCGNEDAVVLIGLLGDGDVPEGGCTFGSSKASPTLRALVRSFGDRGFVGSICNDDYAALFSSAVQTVDNACDELIVY